jgi:hypothetical protein
MPVSDATGVSTPASSPFLDEFRFLDEARPRAGDRLPIPGPQDSPFVSSYQVAENIQNSDPEAEEFAAFISELEDDEFQDALYEMAEELTVPRDEEYAEEWNDGAAGVRAAELEWEAPLQQVEMFFESVGSRLGDADSARLSEAEIDLAVDESMPPAELSPAFENLFGSLKRLAKKVAKRAVSVAKTGLKVAASLGLKPIFDQLKSLVPKLLRYWLRIAMKHLPASLQPAAMELSKRLGMKWDQPKPTAPVAPTAPLDSGANTPADAGAPPVTPPDAADTTGADPTVANVPAGPDVAQLVEEFHHQVAELVYAGSSAEQEMAAIPRWAREAPGQDAMADLDRARVELTENLMNLAPGASAAPHIEQFLPAVLPLAVKVVGRKRVLDLLTRLFAGLLRNFVGKEQVEPLARALVDKGLRLVNLEASPEDELREAAGAVTQTIEETMRRIAHAPDYVLNDEALLEGSVIDAFEQAAAAHLPVLAEQVYAVRPDLRETSGPGGLWTWRGPQGRRRYKRYTKVFEVELKPHVAQTILTFGGQPLASFLRDQLGLRPGDAIRCRVHLYEAMPGASLALIGRMEKHVPGLGSGGNGRLQLHPLTPEAAGLLLGEPRLGRAMGAAFLADRHKTAIGGRYYFLEIPGARLRMAGTGGVKRSSHLRLTFDLVQGQLRARLFLGEAEAQEIARKLRKNVAPGIPLAAVRPLVEGGVRLALSGNARSAKIIHPAVQTAMARGEAWKRLSPALNSRIEALLSHTLLRSVGQLLHAQAEVFVRATEDDADGVTLSWRISAPALLSALSAALEGKAPALDGAAFTQPLHADVTVRPGFHRD